MTHARQVGYGAILSAAIVYGSSAHAVTGPGGTIVFKGALVAPSYAISTQPAAHSAAFTMQQNADATTVTFTALPGGLPSAEVTLTTNAHKTGEHFIDGNGRRILPGKNGAYHIGATGGVLALPAQEPNHVIIVTDYH